jgi:hypothetical protein
MYDMEASEFLGMMRIFKPLNHKVSHVTVIIQG